MGDLFNGESSIADMIRQAAMEVVHSSVPEGFEWIEDYQQYYSKDTRYFYDPNTALFYSSDNLTYYRFNEETYSYDVVECCQPTKWSSSGYRKRAIQAVGDIEFKKFDQDSVDICEILFGMIGKITKEEHIAVNGPKKLPNIAELKAKVAAITAEDIRRMIRKRKRPEDDNSSSVFDERSGDFVQSTSGTQNHNEEFVENDEDDESDGNEVIDGDERAILMQEEGFDQAPCLRIMDRNNRLHIITISGGYIGSDPDCEIVLSNQLLPERCAEFSYAEEVGCYTLSKIDESCILQCNSNSTMMNKPVDICHGDVIMVSGEKLEVHLHNGSNTCPSCEPGLFVPEEKPKDELLGNARYIKGELARRKNLKKMMKSYGIAPDQSLSAPIRGPKKPATGPELINIERSVDPYQKCAAQPVAESARRFPIPQSIGATSSVPEPPKPLDSGNVGFKLLKSMGWTEGKGLGKEKQGKVEPVATEIKNNRQGLGAKDSSKEKPKTFKEAILEKTKQRFNEKR